MVGMLAASKAGHDKSKVYVIVKEEPEYIYLVDGKSRTWEKPKKKNKKHIQIIKKYPDAEFPERVRTGKADDIEIRKVLQQYQTSRKQEVVNVKS
ncbi:MAG: hypothetical protein NC321_15190 [Clostridium sp.]|nr:hypothetical protein [Clostridium sp.]